MLCQPEYCPITDGSFPSGLFVAVCDIYLDDAEKREGFMLTHNSFPSDQMPAGLTRFLCGLPFEKSSNTSCQKWQMKANKVNYHFLTQKGIQETQHPQLHHGSLGSLVRHDTLHVVMDWAEAWSGIDEEMEGKPWWMIVMDMRERAPKDIKRWFDFQTCQESHLCLEGWPNLANIFKLGWNMLKPADSTLHVEFSIEDFLRWLNMVIHPECCKHDTQRDSFQAFLRMPGHQIWDTSQPLTAKCQFRTV